MESDVHILVVDDSRAMRETVVRTLTEQEGFVTREATDGAEGLEMALADPPDLILIDLEMPKRSGLEVVDALRAHEADIPIILMTSHGSEAIAVELFRKGVKDYLIKPFAAKEMLAAIDRALTEVHLRQEKKALTQNLAKTNQELRRRVQELDTLYQVGKTVTSQLSRDQLLERILDAVFRVANAEEAVLMLKDEEAGELQPKLHRRRVKGEEQHAGNRSATELITKAAREGKATDTGAMLSAPLKVGGRLLGVLFVANRVSAKPFSKRDRQLLLALVDYAAIALENARLYENVRRANRAKSEFVSFVAHELKQPITSIRGYADMLLKEMSGSLTSQQKEFAQTIHNNTTRMQLLISDLQDISRIETQQLRLEVETIQLRGSLEEALQAVENQIEDRSQHLTVKVSEDLPAIRADPARLTQILINLLSNAYKYTPEEGRIHVQAWHQNGYVHCAVCDTGIGISPGDQEQLFTKFFRSEEPAVREKPGTGLGLCIVKNLVELQGGRISVKSEPGQGTAVTFTVPVAEE